MITYLLCSAAFTIGYVISGLFADRRLDKVKKELMNFQGCLALHHEQMGWVCDCHLGGVPVISVVYQSSDWRMN